MAATESQMLPLGTTAPAFSLPDPDGVEHGLAAHAPAHLVMFICNHCPFVVHVQDELARLGADYGAHGVDIIAISSNDVTTHPQDGPAYMKRFAAENGFGFPYLYDESQAVAKAYRAACTPDFFLFDGDKRLVYRGQLDDARPGKPVPVDGRDLRAALDAVLAGRHVGEDQRASMGCNIKWKAGEAPAYA
ncbi:MAG: thioredoxin family protein [Pseudomonadota bacterium]